MARRQEVSFGGQQFACGWSNNLSTNTWFATTPLDTDKLFLDQLRSIKVGPRNMLQHSCGKRQTMFHTDSRWLQTTLDGGCQQLHSAVDAVVNYRALTGNLMPEVETTARRKWPKWPTIGGRILFCYHRGETVIITPQRSIVISTLLCVRVRMDISITTWPIFTEFLCISPWPWLSPSLAILRYVLYLWFSE